MDTVQRIFFSCASVDGDVLMALFRRRQHAHRSMRKPQRMFFCPLQFDLSTRNPWIQVLKVRLISSPELPEYWQNFEAFGLRLRPGLACDDLQPMLNSLL